MSDAAPPVRATTVKRFLKERTELRVGDATATVFVELLTNIAERLTDVAKAQAQSEGRSTLLERDVQTGFETFLAEEGPSLLSAAVIHNAIEGIPNESLTELIQLLEAELVENRP